MLVLSEGESEQCNTTELVGQLVQLLERRHAQLNLLPCFPLMPTHPAYQVRDISAKLALASTNPILEQHLTALDLNEYLNLVYPEIPPLA